MPQRPERILLGIISVKMGNLKSLSKGMRSLRMVPKKPTGSISMVIVSHNRMDDLRRCLDSIMVQKVKPKEVIVVDNASTDGTMEMIRKEFPEVRLFVLSGNMGLCYATNVGSKNAKGDYIGIAEANMVLSSNWTQEVINELESNKDAGIACPVFLHHSKYGYINFEFEQPNNELQITNVCFGIRGSIVEENGGNLYDPKYFFHAQEEELSARVLRLGLRIKRVTAAKTFHRADTGDRNLQAKLLQRYKTRNNLWNLWRFYSKRNIVVFTPVYMAKFLAEVRNPVRFTRILAETLMGIPYCLKRRKTVKVGIYESAWKHLKYRRAVRKIRFWFDNRTGNVDPRHLMRLDGIEKLKQEMN